MTQHIEKIGLLKNSSGLMRLVERISRNMIVYIYLIIRRCARTGAFPGAFCVPNSVALASPTLWGVQWAIH